MNQRLYPQKAPKIALDLCENWPRYSGTALYINYVCLNINFLKQIYIYGEVSRLTDQTKYSYEIS